MKRIIARYGAVVCLLALACLQSASACPVCFGETESGSEVGVNAAVWVMLGITGTVLSLFSALFMRFRRRMKMTLNGTVDFPTKN